MGLGSAAHVRKLTDIEKQKRIFQNITKGELVDIVMPTLSNNCRYPTLMGEVEILFTQLPKVKLYFLILKVKETCCFLDHALLLKSLIRQPPRDTVRTKIHARLRFTSY